MKAICSVGACALIALCAVPATAQSERPRSTIHYVDVRPDLAATSRSATSTQVFDLLDRNRDGRLDEAELAAEAAQRYDWIAMDTDGDGHISRTEFTVLRPRAVASSR